MRPRRALLRHDKLGVRNAFEPVAADSPRPARERVVMSALLRKRHLWDPISSSAFDAPSGIGRYLGVHANHVTRSICFRGQLTGHISSQFALLAESCSIGLVGVRSKWAENVSIGICATLRSGA